ncbi:MAG: hypothetical protein VXZ82_20850 [Planctomycetota bacterium]|nr:hypothetical protein [Planctomycetota bacterium]
MGSLFCSDFAGSIDDGDLADYQKTTFAAEAADSTDVGEHNLLFAVGK